MAIPAAQLIIQLRKQNELSSAIFDGKISETERIASERLPELIHYSPFYLLPLSTLSRIFESPSVCMPSQIELSEFILQFFHIVGIDAISFVHYLKPIILPQSYINRFNQVFQQFDCAHLFPQFKFEKVSPGEIKKLTIQCEISNRKMQNTINQEQQKSNDLIKQYKNLKNSLTTNLKLQKDVDELEQLDIMKDLPQFELYENEVDIFNNTAPGVDITIKDQMVREIEYSKEEISVANENISRIEEEIQKLKKYVEKFVELQSP